MSSARHDRPLAQRARPFPWETLDSTTRAEAEALRGARRWAAQYVALNALEDALSHLVGANVEVRLRRVHALPEAGEFGEGLGVFFSSAEEPAGRRLALALVERALATELVARTIRRTPPVIIDTAAGRSAAMAGALAAILLSAARRSHGDVVLRVIGAGDARALETEVASAGTGAVAIALTVLVANNAYAARVVLWPSVIASAPPSSWNRAGLSRLGPTPLEIPIVACALTLTTADVAALGPGDVLVLSDFPLARKVGAWVGPVLLAPPGGATAVRADLGEGGRLVLRGDVVPLDAAEAQMGESEGSSAIVDAVGEIPVVVRVEIGQARMLAREWAALGRGDVIALSQRVGERVVIRIGGVVVARGDLVEIDGEVGVRVVDRLVEEPPDS